MALVLAVMYECTMSWIVGLRLIPGEWHSRDRVPKKVLAINRPRHKLTVLRHHDWK